MPELRPPGLRELSNNYDGLEETDHLGLVECARLKIEFNASATIGTDDRPPGRLVHGSE